MSNSLSWAMEIEGDFPIHQAISQVLPKGAKLISAESFGVSNWTKTAKLNVVLEDGGEERYFLKCASGKGARPLAEGAYHSAATIQDAVPGFCPKPIAWGQYHNGEAEVYFYISSFHDMDLATAPDPLEFTTKIAQLHIRESPTGKFGYPVPTAIGIMERTVTWEESWAKSFTSQLRDAIKFDNKANGHWAELDAAYKQLIDAVIPRLLGVLQSDGRSIKPALVHGDLWEQNVGIDKKSGEIIVFDAGCMYAHNEMEFGTWRCSWAGHFNAPEYRQLYQRHFKPSEPKEEWDDRNRLYSIHPYLVNSAGHPESRSRKIAYNDMLYLCEKYAPLDGLEKYDASIDISVTGTHIMQSTQEMDRRL